jgi:hypothetical protein
MKNNHFPLGMYWNPAPVKLDSGPFLKIRPKSGHFAAGFNLGLNTCEARKWRAVEVAGQLHATAANQAPDNLRLASLTVLYVSQCVIHVTTRYCVALQCTIMMRGQTGAPARTSPSATRSRLLRQR